MPNPWAVVCLMMLNVFTNIIADSHLFEQRCFLIVELNRVLAAVAAHDFSYARMNH